MPCYVVRQQISYLTIQVFRIIWKYIQKNTTPGIYYSWLLFNIPTRSNQR